jgi:hypothetical protein
MRQPEFDRTMQQIAVAARADLADRLACFTLALLMVGLVIAPLAWKLHDLLAHLPAALVIR